MAPRGRPVSATSRAAALASATELLDERGWSGFSIDEVARRSGVGKATVYRHWSGAFALAVEAWGSVVTTAVPTTPTGDAPADLHDQVVRLAAFYASSRGTVAAQLLGAGVSQPGGPELVRSVFFGARRTATVALIEDGQAAGTIRADVTPDTVIDLLFGPIVFRLLNGLGPLDDTGARALADLALPAVAVPPDARPVRRQR